MINKLKVIFKNIYSYIFTIEFSIKRFDIKGDERYLNFLASKYKDTIKKDDSLKSYFYRSFFQYKCQIYKLSFAKKFILISISIICLPLFIVISVFSSFLIRNKKQQVIESNKIAILATKLRKDLIPKSISSKYKIVCSIPKGFILNKDGLKLLKFFIENFYFHPYFILKSIIKISLYSYFCFRYNPKAIIVSSEYSFTSSILTHYLEGKNILHINVMHGEKLFNIRDSFFRFSECWVWDKHYVDLFKKLFAYKNQFKIEIPPWHKRLVYVYNKSLSKNKKILKFYWASELDKNELHYISDGLSKLKENGFEIIVRYHPYKKLFSGAVNRHFNDFIIENPKNKNIYNSLLETYYVFGTYSTVLLEAYLMGKVIVINDYENNLSKLKSMDYILMKNGRYISFSKLLKDYGCN